MDFDNDRVRIGPTGVQNKLFKIEKENGKKIQGKKREIPEYLVSKKLNAYEFPAGRLAKFSDNHENQMFRKNSEKWDLAVSLHAPYYISLTSEDDAIYTKSIERLAHCYAWATYINAKRIVLHPGSYGKSEKSSKKVSLEKFMESKVPKAKSINQSKIQQIILGIKEGIELADKLHPDLKPKFKQICLCPETMGKLGQMGTIPDIIEICKSVGLNYTRPCVDFGHLYARSLGKIPENKLYTDAFDLIEAELGSKVVQSLHIHYSIVEYGTKGEIKHHENQNQDWGPKIDELFQLILERDFTPIIINESPALEADAQLLVQKWELMQKNANS